MALLRQLFAEELVHLDHLAREVAAVIETFGEEHDLGNEGVVRDHHRHGTEEHFQVVGQLGPAGVTWVHSHVYGEGLYLDFAALEMTPLVAAL